MGRKTPDLGISILVVIVAMVAVNLPMTILDVQPFWVRIPVCLLAGVVAWVGYRRRAAQRE